MPCQSLGPRPAPDDSGKRYGNRAFVTGQSNCQGSPLRPQVSLRSRNTSTWRPVRWHAPYLCTPEWDARPYPSCCGTPSPGMHRHHPHTFRGMGTGARYSERARKRFAMIPDTTTRPSPGRLPFQSPGAGLPGRRTTFWWRPLDHASRGPPQHSNDICNAGGGTIWILISETAIADPRAHC